MQLISCMSKKYSIRINALLFNVNLNFQTKNNTIGGIYLINLTKFPKYTYSKTCDNMQDPKATYVNTIRLIIKHLP